MTARAGDALSHVYFRVRPNAALMEIRAPEFRDSNFVWHPRRIRAAFPQQEIVPALFAWRP